MSEESEPPVEWQSGESPFVWIPVARDLVERHESVVPLPEVPTAARVYEATICDLPGTGAAVHVVSAPVPGRYRASFQEGSSAAYLMEQEVGTALGVETGSTRRIEDLVASILYVRPDRAASYEGGAGLYEEEVSPHDFVLRDVDRFREFVGSRDRQLLQFADRLAFEPIIPVEGSPLSATSVTSLLAQTSASGALCTMTGIHGYVLLIVTPLMVVVMGAAFGLGEGLRRRLLAWSTGTSIDRLMPPAEEQPPGELKA